MISYDDFSKVEIKAGKILSAEKVPATDKLLKLSVDFGVIESAPAPVVVSVPAPVAASGVVVPVSAATVTTPVSTPILTPTPVAEPCRDIRQIVSGISLYFPEPAVLVGKTCMFVTNLEPRKIKGLESNGMLFALSTKDGKFSLLEPGKDIPEGTRAY